MKVSSLLVESNSRATTGSSAVDSLIESVVGRPAEYLDNLPVSVDQSAWITLDSPERISRTFSFSSLAKLKYFVNELLSYQERVYHHAMISIQGNSVTVETHTHDVNRVTNQDLRLARFADEVYEDTRYFHKQ